MFYVAKQFYELTKLGRNSIRKTDKVLFEMLDLKQVGVIKGFEYKLRSRTNCTARKNKVE